jgi:hypothetical protein
MTAKRERGKVVTSWAERLERHLPDVSERLGESKRSTRQRRASVLGDGPFNGRFHDSLAQPIMTTDIG